MNKRKGIKDKKQKEKDDICVQIRNTLSKVVSCKDIIDEYIETYDEVVKEFPRELASMNGKIWILDDRHVVKFFKNVGTWKWTLELRYDYNKGVTWGCEHDSYEADGVYSSFRVFNFEDIDKIVKWFNQCADK